LRALTIRGSSGWSIGYAGDSCAKVFSYLLQCKDIPFSIG